MISIEAILKRGVIKNGKSFLKDTKSNLLTFGISENESTSSFQAISEKEKTTNKEEELQELSELKSVAEKPKSSLVPQVKCHSNFIDYNWTRTRNQLVHK